MKEGPAADLGDPKPVQRGPTFGRRSARDCVRFHLPLPLRPQGAFAEVAFSTEVQDSGEEPLNQHSDVPLPLCGRRLYAGDGLRLAHQSKYELALPLPHPPRFQCLDPDGTPWVPSCHREAHVDSQIVSRLSGNPSIESEVHCAARAILPE